MMFLHSITDERWHDAAGKTKFTQVRKYSVDASSSLGSQLVPEGEEYVLKEGRGRPAELARAGGVSAEEEGGQWALGFFEPAFYTWLNH